ncbi:MAG: CusA/CzcA family heavy metal efflux RND transporter [Bacteroidetes bacterium]|jgi:cobalt-zinc-cadmium resistance protein CzcA|nr:CusA/CzcA family heavy metal efflux RND transporter [Bacteroidota bacterium]
MFRSIINFSVRHKALVGFLVALLIGFGIYSMFQIPIDAVPDITNNQVQVVTQSPSLSPQEVERFITYPLELTMANISDVEEIRSVSRYGLSVITVVFDEMVPILDARQLVNEQLQMARNDIPESVGNPEMLPITTGLGEVYQYTLEVDNAYKHQYTITDLREIQDWIVKRQLSGIPGIVEISSFGGYLKQYEIAVSPALLAPLNLTLADVYQAIYKNNENIGGSYIEKNENAWYIRAEGLVEDMHDLKNTVITTNNGMPVLVKDVADVKIGHAPRFGAMTKNGEGEAVGGITLMLKGANSSVVIEKVKERIKEVEKSLPEGIQIESYLDRAELVKKTTRTVAQNLIEGGLIVIFVLVFLLGNFRSGLIVASVIPLSLLFGFIMMRIFGISANLMSLGAIDFGIVIDGAVIIVESILYHLHTHFSGKKLSKTQMDREVSKSASTIYHSAAFGVFIILIVFIPIMSLSGIEGKMFKPMAQTFAFVILGAFFLSITYVPMMSALVLKKNIVNKRTISDKVIRLLKITYYPVLRFSLANRNIILGITGLVFIIAIWSFSKLGGEFLPTLEEGDLAMQMTVPTGSSLSQSIKTSTQAERILLDHFPEVEQVVSKIGTAEVPTDPMAIEDADIMIILKDKKEWVSAKTREELIAKMKEKLEDISWASFEFTQPIQLRFNELMTGVKTDIAVKIYGEDIDELYAKANEAAAYINDLEGASDIRVEQITGLPQLIIAYDRSQIARYGLNIKELNHHVKMAFAGEKAGVLFEGERQFDIVVRLDSAYRNTMDISQIMVQVPRGGTIPLSELATVEEYTGPVQIARDNTKRRAIIGVNVRNRDVASLVDEIDQTLTQNLTLKPGYYITYGGQFENLENARDRLMVAVPIALLLILVLLFFTFNSIKYALLIFTAVPLSAVGGIAALWIRGMPFSISAGVGFIALFGVAVLNGIVLISYYNSMRKEGITNTKYIIVKGACTRLRPVLMTAVTDILGFLPMAISTSAGGEVQRPLATVVIGGLITSTMLTLIILPILYLLINKKQDRLNFKNVSKAGIIVLLLGLGTIGNAQQSDFLKLQIDEAVSMAMDNHPKLKNALLAKEAEMTLKKDVLQLPPTEFNVQYGEINSGITDYSWEVKQSIGSIPEHIVRNKWQQQQIQLAEANIKKQQAILTRDVKQAYLNLAYHHEILEIYYRQKELYDDLKRIANLRYEHGEYSLLEKMTAETRQAEIENQYLSQQDEVITYENKLKELIFAKKDIVPTTDITYLYEIAKKDSGKYQGKAFLKPFEINKEKTRLKSSEFKSSFFPELAVGYFQQQIDGVTGFSGFVASATFPLWFLTPGTQIKKRNFEHQMAINEYNYKTHQVEITTTNLILELHKYFRQVQHYHDYALQNADELVKTAELKFNKEEIDYVDYIQSLNLAFEIQKNYLDVIKQYNQTAIELEVYAQ